MTEFLSVMTLTCTIAKIVITFTNYAYGIKFPLKVTLAYTEKFSAAFRPYKTDISCIWYQTRYYVIYLKI